jgi:hypothetical protein
MLVLKLDLHLLNIELFWKDLLLDTEDIRYH